VLRIDSGKSRYRRLAAAPEVLRLVAALSPDEQQGLADYTSRLTALTAAGAAH
jgi:hypothetical protein